MATYDITYGDKSFVVHADDAADPAKVEAWARQSASMWDDGEEYTYEDPDARPGLRTASPSADKYSIISRNNKFYAVPRGKGTMGEDYDAYMNEEIKADAEFATAEDAQEWIKAKSDLPNLRSPDPVRLRPKEVAREQERLRQNIERMEKEQEKIVGPQTPVDPSGESFVEGMRNPLLDKAISEDKDRLSDLDTRGLGEVGGALAGATTGGMTGMAVGGPIGAGIGAIVGAAVGSFGGRLYDASQAAEVQEITPQEMFNMAKESAIESVVFDGATMLILGPGGKALGMITGKAPLARSLKRLGIRIRNWEKVRDQIAAREKGGRLAEMSSDPRLSTQVSDKVLPENQRLPQPEADRRTGKLLEDTQRDTGYWPSEGEMRGDVPGGFMGERFRRYIAPDPFKESADSRGHYAARMRDSVNKIVDDPNLAYNSSDRSFGDTVHRMLASADETLKMNFRPVVQRAEEIGGRGFTIDTTPMFRFIESQWVAGERAGWINYTAEEKAVLKKYYDALKPEASTIGPGMVGPAVPKKLPPEDMLSIASNLKREMRDASKTGSPSEPVKKMLNNFIDVTDATFDDAARKIPGGGKIADDLIDARKEYRRGMRAVYSKWMTKMLRTDPDKVGAALNQKGSQVSIQQLREAMALAEEIAPQAHSRLTTTGKVVYGQKDLARERERIENGLIRGYLKANTNELTDLPERLKDEKFRTTLRELITGINQTPGGRQRSAKVLKELDKLTAAIQLSDPRLLPKPHRVLPPGAPSEFAMARGFTGGGFTHGVVLLGTTVLGVNALAKAMTRAATTGNTSTINKMTRLFLLSSRARSNAAAGEAARKLMQEIQDELGLNLTPSGELEEEAGS